MPLDPRHPAICGVAQHVQRVDDAREAVSPIEMMERALRAAAEDAGAPKLLSAIDAILVPRGLWKYPDPGRMLGERVGSPRATTGLGEISGHITQVLVDWAFREIAAGRREIVAIVGGESEHSKRRAKRQGIELDWPAPVPGEPDIRFGDGQYDVHPGEVDAGIFRPTMSFALCDTSLRHARGETPAEHRIRISQLSSRLSAVAATNPHAWIQRRVSAEEIRTPNAQNRWVAYPYTKLMTSNIAVDQSAALIICSDAAARRFGVRDEKRIFLRAATEMHHVARLSDRLQLHHHPGLDIAGQRVLEIAGAELDAFAHIDLYSCFPFAVQVGAAAIGADEERPLTVTGGLTFSGGPFGNYVVQSHARMIELLRADRGKLGLIGSVGGSFAKFAFAAYSAEPGSDAEPHIDDVSADFAALPTRPCLESYAGPARVESYVVDIRAEGPSHAAFSALTPAGERVWARSEDASLLAALTADEDACGRDAHMSAGGIELR